MKKDASVYLEEIRDSCERIASYIKDKNKTDFDNSLELQDAVIRRLIIVGEIIKRLPQYFRDEHPNIPWRKAAGMRDVLIPLRENPRDVSPQGVERVFSLRWGFQLSTKRIERLPYVRGASTDIILECIKLESGNSLSPHLIFIRRSVGWRSTRGKSAAGFIRITAGRWWWLLRTMRKKNIKKK